MAFTAKQKAALARAPKAQRAKMAAAFAVQDAQRSGQKNGKGNGNGGGSGKGYGNRKLAQGVGSVPSRAFGGSRGYGLSCWDATHPSHIPLPRSVGDYQVIRTTKRFLNTKNVTIVGSFMHESVNVATNKWTNICAVSDVNAANPINDPTGNVDIHTMDLSGLGPAATVVPAAITVQIMNPGALQTTNGITYIGVMKTQADWGGSTLSWTTRADQFVQFMAPRLCSAGKLALKGVKVSSFPLNMTACSDFQEVVTYPEGPQVWNADNFAPVGWAPIIVYNPGEAALEMLITIEWRVRFDLTNPASATHRHFPCSSDSQWDRLMAAASSLGHGVRDIADTVASVGAAAEGMARLGVLAVP